MPMRLILSLAALSLAVGFTAPQQMTRRASASLTRQKRLGNALFSSARDQGAEEDDDDLDDAVTKDMLMRDMLADPKTKRKNKKGRYRTMDNRDSLPFVVQVSTPDPYTSNDDMKKEARRNTKKAAKKSKNGGVGGTVRRNLVGMDLPGRRDGISSSIYSRRSDGSLHRVLGEFKLDKNTNCGDLVEVGDREFEVQKARCQYKYVGGKQFVMVRKILEVKEVTRIAEENYLKRQFQNSEYDDDVVPPLE